MSKDLENIKHISNGDYFVIPIETGYIKPNENLNSIINPAKEIMEDGDYLVIAWNTDFSFTGQTGWWIQIQTIT